MVPCWSHRCHNTDSESTGTRRNVFLFSNGWPWPRKRTTKCPFSPRGMAVTEGMEPLCHQKPSGQGPPCVTDLQHLSLGDRLPPADRPRGLAPRGGGPLGYLCFANDAFLFAAEWGTGGRERKSTRLGSTLNPRKQLSPAAVFRCSPVSTDPPPPRSSRRQGWAFDLKASNRCSDSRAPAGTPSSLVSRGAPRNAPSGPAVFPCSSPLASEAPTKGWAAWLGQPHGPCSPGKPQASTPSCQRCQAPVRPTGCEWARKPSS